MGEVEVFSLLILVVFILSFILFLKYLSIGEGYKRDKSLSKSEKLKLSIRKDAEKAKKEK